MKLNLIIIFLLSSLVTFSQNATLKGIISDSATNQSLIGASITVTNFPKLGSRTNIKGNYVISIPAGTYQLIFSYAGFQSKIISLSLTANESRSLNITLLQKTNSLNSVTISGSKFAKPIGEEIVSIEVIKPAQIMNTANNSMDDALNRVPGVDVIENQVNIRGGSGWSYGAGSRVLVLVDDMPMLTADAADAKWDFLPLENCEQIEVLKGASSSLYGSSALNGVVNFRTGFVKMKPKTKAMFYDGVFGNPAHKDWKWWGKQQPSFQGGYFSHAQKFGQWDMVIGSAWFSEDSYLQGDLTRRIRLNTNLRYRSKKVEGLIYGLNLNGQISKAQTFFFWDTAANSFYKPFGGLNDATSTINKNQGQRFNVDPYITYVSKSGTKHTLRTRWFRSRNDIPEKQQSSLADLYYGEYQFQKEIKSENKMLNELRIVAGFTGIYSNVIGELYGNHSSINSAPYLQLEKKIDNLWLSAGARYEFNKLDERTAETKPIFRFGGNYKIVEATHLRASFGQGYRYPSIAERFVKTSFGASKVFPNPTLKSETGWSSEIGLKQGFKIGSWQGMADVALFWTEYKDMMEFNFGLHLPDDSTASQVVNALDYLGFKSKNVGETRINGIDFSIAGEGNIGKINSKIIFGYTYMNPIQLNPDSIISANISGATNTLKYRYRNSLKFDIENSFRKVTFGGTVLYNSFMQNIDEVFENSKPEVNIFGSLFQYGTGLPSTIKTFRDKYNKGTIVIDLRSSFQLSKQIKMAFIVKNILNTVYAERPALISAPRNFTLQLGVEL